MYRQFNIQQFYVLPTQLYLCVLCGSQNKQRLFPYTTLTDCSHNRHLTLYNPVAWLLCSAALSALNPTRDKQTVMFPATPWSMSIITRAFQSQPNPLHCTPPTPSFNVHFNIIHVSTSSSTTISLSFWPPSVSDVCHRLSKSLLLLTGGCDGSCKCCGDQQVSLTDRRNAGCEVSSR